MDEWRNSPLALPADKRAAATRAAVQARIDKALAFLASRLDKEDVWTARRLDALVIPFEHAMPWQVIQEGLKHVLEPLGYRLDNWAEDATKPTNKTLSFSLEWMNELDYEQHIDYDDPRAKKEEEEDAMIAAFAKLTKPSDIPSASLLATRTRLEVVSTVAIITLNGLNACSALMEQAAAAGADHVMPNLDFGHMPRVAKTMICDRIAHELTALGYDTSTLALSPDASKTVGVIRWADKQKQ